ncbi:MAG: nucleotidyltransferase family protein [Burkholderiales bacterium]
MNWLDSPLVRALRDPRTLAGFDDDGWSLLLRQASSAGLLGRLHAQAAALGIEAALPKAVRRQMNGIEAAVRRQTQAVHWEVRHIAAALEQIGAPIVLLKGAAYAAAGLPAALGRTFSDVDVLVPKAEIARVEYALGVCGWASGNLDAYDQRYYRRWMHELPPMVHFRRLTPLDVHHNILPETARIRTYPDRIIAAATPLAGYRQVFVPSRVDQVLHSATHLFHEGEWEHGLRDLSDLDLLLRAYGERTDFWTALTARGDEMNLRRPLAYALRYTQLVLHTPIPESVLREFGGTRSRAKDRLMDFLFLNGLASAHHSLRTRHTAVAQILLYMRSHWLRMPLHLLAPHLLHKALPRKESQVA